MAKRSTLERISRLTGADIPYLLSQWPAEHPGLYECVPGPNKVWDRDRPRGTVKVILSTIAPEGSKFRVERLCLTKSCINPLHYTVR